MIYEVDHVFIMCASGAPEAEALLRLGLTEGTANNHPGQGTACRRFFFHGSYLELVWVSDAAEAQNSRTLPTRLYERWAGRGEGICPFGIILRPVGNSERARTPFPTWSYHPQYLPPELAIELAAGVPLTEPELFYFSIARRPVDVGREPLVHTVPLEWTTSFTVGLPGVTALSPAAQEVERLGAVSFAPSPAYLLTVDFEGTGGHTADLRPVLPLVLRW